jgi:hypothetical protein
MAFSDQNYIVTKVDVDTSNPFLIIPEGLLTETPSNHKGADYKQRLVELLDQAYTLTTENYSSLDFDPEEEAEKADLERDDDGPLTAAYFTTGGTPDYALAIQAFETVVELRVLRENIVDTSWAVKNKHAGVEGQSMYDFDRLWAELSEKVAKCVVTDQLPVEYAGGTDPRENNFGSLNFKIVSDDARLISTFSVVNVGYRWTGRSAYPNCIEASPESYERVLNDLNRLYSALCTNKQSGDKIIVAFDRHALKAAV